MRLKEHQAATREGETEKSAIAEHAWSRHHQPLWEETRVLDRASHTTTLLIKEAIHISFRDPVELLNRTIFHVEVFPSHRYVKESLHWFKQSSLGTNGYQ